MRPGDTERSICNQGIRRYRPILFLERYHRLCSQEDHRWTGGGHADSIHDVACLKKLLDGIGLSNEVQTQVFRIKKSDNNNNNNNGEAVVLTCLQAQLPEDAISLAKQYIKLRWELLFDLEHIIATGGNWKETIVAKFARTDPIDFTALQILELNPWGHGIFPNVRSNEAS